MSLYDDIGVSPNATPEEIAAAGKRAQKRTHPDKPGGSQEEFVKVTNALTVLKDPDARAHYDRTGEAKGPVDQAMMEEREAMNLLGQVLMQVMQSADPLYTDVVREMRDAIHRNVANLKTQIREAETQVTRLEKFLARLKRKTKGDDFLSNGIRMQIQGQGQRKAGAEQGVRVNDLALKMLHDYEYAAERREQNGWQTPGPGGSLLEALRQQQSNPFFTRY